MFISIGTGIQRNLKSIATLFIIGLLVYLPSVNNAFVWDDEQFIYNNAFVKNFAITEIFTQNTIAGAGEISSYYRPLTTLSFAFDYALWQLNSIGFHLTNMVLHIASGILLFFLLKLLLFSNKLALIVGLLFLVHPIQTEAVIYANSRGDSLFTFFSLTSLICLTAYISKKSVQLSLYDLTLNLSYKVLGILTPFFYLLSILSKEIGIATFGLMFITTLFLLQKKVFLKKNLSTLAVLLASTATAFLYLIVRTKIISIPASLNTAYAQTPYGENVYVRLHTFTLSLWTYFRLLLFPYPLHMERDIEIQTSLISPWLILTIMLCAVIVSLGWYELRKKQTANIWFGSLWFIIPLIPVSGIIPINGLFYEHWLYMPMIGFYITLYGVYKLFVVRSSHLLNELLILYIIVLSAATVRQNYLWGTPIRFYEYTLQFSETARLRNNLAMSYAQEKNHQKAIENYHRAIELADYYPQTHFNLANTYVALNNLDAAKDEYATAIRMNSEFLPAYSQLIKISLVNKEYQNALTLLKTLEGKVDDNPKILAEIKAQIQDIETKISSEKP